MSIRSLLSRSIAALAGVSMLAASLAPAAGFTLAAPSLQQPFASSQIENVQWCRWNCGGWHQGWGWRAGYGWQPGWRGYGWQGPGWGPAAVVTGLAAGAIVGAAIASAPPPAPVYYAGPCWQRWFDPYGYPHWRRVC